MDKFEEFKSKEKFAADTLMHYTGITDETLRIELTQKINLAADDFKKLAESGKATESDYQDRIEVGLKRFDSASLDTEDRERVCHYFEELMDIVGLESSGGKLNEWMYGFDPTSPSTD